MRRPLLAALVVVALVPAGAMGSVQGSPDLSVSVADATVTPGRDATLQVRLVNEGDLDDGSARNPALNDEVTTARGVTVTLDASDAPFEVETDARTLGRLPRGANPSLGFDLSVPGDAEPGTYTVPVTVEYTHTAHIAESNGARQTLDVERTFDVTVEVREVPQFRVVGVDHDVRVGTTGTVDLTIENVGSATANGTSVAVRTENGDLGFGASRSTTRFVGDWAPGETRNVSYRVTAAPDAGTQRYAFAATASYETAGDDRQSEPLQFAVRPAPEQRFAVVEVASDVAVGEDGNVSVTLRNTGSAAVEAATVELASSHADIRFGGAASATRFVGEWAPGETRTVSYRAAAADGAETRSYALRATVAYRDASGDRRTYRVGPLGVTPRPESAGPVFDLADVSATLRAGEDGRLRGTLVNGGDAPARDVVLVLDPPGTGLNPEAAEYPVGDLGPGERASFTFDVAVSADAAIGPRQFALVPEYRGGDGDARTGDELTVRRRVAEGRSTLAVEAVDAIVAPGSATAFAVEVTNTGEEPVSDVSAKLFADDPITAADDEAYVDALAPGETATLRFEVSAAGGAMPKEYPVSVDLRYDDPDGDTRTPDSTQVAVSVEESGGGGGGLPVPLLGGVGALALAGVGAYVRFG